jgi:DNA-directed RNA polymerase beta subunit
MKQMFKLNAIDDVERIVQVGDEIEVGDPLITFGLGDTGDKAVDNFLKAFQDKDGSNSAIDSAKRVMRSKEAGTVVDVKIYTCKSMDRLSPSLYDIVDKHFKENIKRRKTLDKYERGNNVYKMGMLYDRPTEPLKGSTIKGITCDVLVEIYIEHEDEASVGDKCVAYAASKQVLSEVIPEGLEPYSETRPDEEISMFVAPASILKRMIPSIVIIASGNKVLVETKRKIREIWEKG